MPLSSGPAGAGLDPRRRFPGSSPDQLYEAFDSILAITFLGSESGSLYDEYAGGSNKIQFYLT